MIDLSAGSVRVVVDENGGGRILKLAVGDLDLLVTPEIDDHNHGLFPMAPWAGRIRYGKFSFAGDDYQLPCNKAPHAIHGTVRDQPWKIDSSSLTHLELSTDLVEPWPFGGKVMQRFELEPNSLSLTMEVHASDRPMPVSCGWHPWWHRTPQSDDSVELELHAERMYHRDGEGIPSGELVPIAPPPWDDCFTKLGEPAAVLRWPELGSLTIESDCECIVVYTEPDLALCVEPQSDPPDSFNLNARVVNPGSPLVINAKFYWTINTAI